MPDADPEDGEAAELDDPQLEATQEALVVPNLGAPQWMKAPPRAGATLGRPRNVNIGEMAAAPLLRAILRPTPMCSPSGCSTKPAVSCGTTSTARSMRTSGVVISRANSLYYNIADFSVWDYCGGVEDIAARKLKLIGDPETRFREDPVRMLRAARFEAKLGFAIDPGDGRADRRACAICWVACRRRVCSMRR